jgi:hypothetical protein
LFTECSDCSPGHFSNTANVAACEARNSDGSYGGYCLVDTVGGTCKDNNCTTTGCEDRARCPDGTYYDTVGGPNSLMCQVCDTGYFSNASAFVDTLPKDGENYQASGCYSCSDYYGTGWTNSGTTAEDHATCDVPSCGSSNSTTDRKCRCESTEGSWTIPLGPCVCTYPKTVQSDSSCA